PRSVEDLFRGPARAIAAIRYESGRLVVELDVTLHHRSDAANWAAGYRAWLETLTTDLGVPANTIVHRLDLAGVGIHARVELEQDALSALVARHSGGRLLTTQPAPPPAPSEGLSP